MSLFAALRLLFNAAALLGGLALAAALGFAATRAQPLPWTHLALGKLIREAGSLPASEGLLFTAPRAGFDASGWAWDWSAAWAWETWGETALRLADALAWGLAALALAAAAFRRGARPFSSAAFAAWALLAARPDLAPGPGLLGFAAFAAALWIFEGDFWTALFSRWAWAVPLAVLAVNATPAAWALAPLALLWAAAGEGGQPARSPWLARLAYLAVLIGCLCLHPQGAAPLLRALRALPGTPLAPEAFAPRQAGLLLLAASAALLVAGSWLREGRRHLGRDALLLTAFGGAALLSRAALPWALALAAPLAASRFDRLVDALPLSLQALRWPAKLAAAAALGLWLAAGGLQAALSPAPAPRPRQSADTLRDILAEGRQAGEKDPRRAYLALARARVLCPPEWTPELAWRLPGLRFALDERGLAEPRAARALAAALRGGEGEGEPAGLDAEGVDLCWLPLGSPLARRLAMSQRWQPVAFDDAAVVYVRARENAALVRARAPRGLRPGVPERPVDPNLQQQAETDLEAALAEHPEMGVVYLYTAELRLLGGREAKARETLEAGIRADPAFAPCYARLADLRAANGDLEAARRLYRLALERREEPAWRRSLAELGRR